MHFIAKFGDRQVPLFRGNVCNNKNRIQWHPTHWQPGSRQTKQWKLLAHCSCQGAVHRFPYSSPNGLICFHSNGFYYCLQMWIFKIKIVQIVERSIGIYRSQVLKFMLEHWIIKINTGSLALCVEFGRFSFSLCFQTLVWVWIRMFEKQNRCKRIEVQVNWKWPQCSWYVMTVHKPC